MKKGVIFVLVQFTCIFFLLKSTSLFSISWGLFVQIGAVFLALWAIWETRRSRISIFPELKEGASLIRTGPYQLIRHPMYSSILLFFFPTLINHSSITVLILYSILFINLVLKLNHEERILLKNFKMYADYKEKTYRLIPYIY